MKMDKTMAIYAVILVLAIGGSFYGGMRYGQTQTSSQVSTQRGQFAGAGGLLMADRIIVRHK